MYLNLDITKLLVAAAPVVVMVMFSSGRAVRFAQVVVIKWHLKFKVANIADTISTAGNTNSTIPDALLVLSVLVLLLPDLLVLILPAILVVLV